MDGWGFICNCQACIDPFIDRSRRRLPELDQRLAAWESPFRRLNTSPLARMMALLMLSNTSEHWKVQKSLLSSRWSRYWWGWIFARRSFRKIHNYIDHWWTDLASYWECSKYSLDLGLFEKAFEYAKALDIEGRIIGTETAHMRDEMIGADYWIEHLSWYSKREYKRETL